ncbi:MAG: hypothetical protein O7H40_09335 [Gammaproteobacteria bacterium]|nr:hypothetical protein [Gammaproteobacteria bacterium]
MNHERLIPVLVVFAVVLCSIPSAVAESGQINGNWMLDEASSENLADAGKKTNKQTAITRREKKIQKFARDEGPKRHGGRFDAQARSTEKMIRDDTRSEVWDPPDLVRIMLEAESIKLYSARKLAVLYGTEVKRLLRMNKDGKSHTMSGKELTADSIGRSLAYLDDEAVMIETAMTAGGKVTERFELDEETDRLMVTVRLQQRARGPWLEFVRYFERRE